jgi:hypothetical protein
MSQWSSQTLGAPGSGPANIGIMDLEVNSQVVVTNNQLGFMFSLITNNQLIAFGGQGIVQAIYNPSLNITVLSSLGSIHGPPVFTLQPANTIVALGGTATLTAAASPATGYQWLFNSAPLTDGNGISGSKSTTLTIAGVTAANVGIYSVLVSEQYDDRPYESAGASLSAEAFTFYPVVTINGVPGNTYEVDYSTSLSSPVWIPLTTVTLSSFTQYVVDTATPRSLVRFYRVVQH